MSNMPKVRFAGYTKEWEKHKLSEVFDYLQNNTLSRAELSLENGVARNVHYGDVLIKFPEYLDVSKSTLPFIESEQTAEKFKDSFLQDGDVVMADTAEDATVGKCSEVAGIDDFPTISGLHTIPMRPKEKYAPGYLGYYMNSDAYHKQLIPLMQGIKVSSVSKSAIKKTSIVSPSEQAEQAAVGKLFIQLECLISFHQEEYEKLVSLRSACTDKMFPKDGNKQPELRLTGFTGDWERHRIIDITTEKLANGIVNRPANSDTSVRHINVINMYSSDRIHTEELSFSAYGDEEVRKCNVKIGDVFLTRSSLKPEGIAAPNVLLNNGQFTFDDHLIRLRIDMSKHDPLFVKMCLESQYLKKQLISASKTTAFTTIGQEDIAECIGFFPSIQEQKRVSEYYQRLDALISLHQHKQEKLKMFKQALLHNMFV